MQDARIVIKYGYYNIHNNTDGLCSVEPPVEPCKSHLSCHQFFNRIPHTEVGQLAFGSRARLLHAHHGQTQMTFYENLFPRSQADCCSGTLILCIFSVIYRLNYNITDTASSISIFVSVYKSHN